MLNSKSQLDCLFGALVCEDDEEESPEIKEIKMIIIEGSQYVTYSDRKLNGVAQKIKVSSLDHTGPFIDLN